ncbi:MAG: asparagine synthase C-terminal domain-containing protein [Nitrososphaerales archaeon]
MLSEEFQFEDLLPFADRKIILSITRELGEVSRKAVSKLEKKNLVVAFSAGIDSSIVSKLISETGSSLDLLALGRDGSADLQSVSGLNNAFLKSSKIHVEIVTDSEIEQAAIDTSKLVSVSSLAHFEDSLSFSLIAKKAIEIPDMTALISANGPDELFCGYDRFRRIVDSSGYESAEKEIRSALVSANLLGREARKVVSGFGLELVEPLFQKEFVDFALTIPIEFKLQRGNDMLRKRIWRFLGRTMKLPEEIVFRPKKAMQYGMGIHRIVYSMLKNGTLKLDFPKGQGQQPESIR